MAEQTTEAQQNTTGTDTAVAATPHQRSLATAQTTATTQTDTTQAQTVEFKRPEKFKTDADGWKAYGELESKLGKGTLAAAPEKYDFEPLTKDGAIQFTNDEQRAGFEKVLKEVGIPQDLLAKSAPAIKLLQEETAKGVMAKMNEQFAAQYGGPTDIPTEINNLKSKWGPDFETRFALVNNFLGTLPPSIKGKPLDWTSDGFDLVYQLIEAKRGPSLIKDTATQTDSASLRNQLDTITANRDYTKNTPEGRKLRDDAARISAQIKR